MEVTKKMQARPPEVLSLGDVLKRISLLKRIVRDVVDCYENFRKSKEFLDELVVIARKFSSLEIEETINRLRREVADSERALEAYEKEIRDLGGILKDRSRGLAYFYSERGPAASSSLLAPSPALRSSPVSRPDRALSGPQAGGELP